MISSAQNLVNSLKSLLPEGARDIIVSLSLKDYNDVFSIFDARDYNECALSDDFLLECKKLAGESILPIHELKLGLPAIKRNSQDEKIIEKRLHTYFLAQAHLWEKERSREKIIAGMMVGIGVLIGFIVSYVLYTGHLHPFLTSLLSVIGEPASWFLIWTGADKLVALYKNDRLQGNFYRKIAHAKITFHDEI